MKYCTDENEEKEAFEDNPQMLIYTNDKFREYLLRFVRQ